MNADGPPPPPLRERGRRLLDRAGRATGTLLLVVFCALMALGIVQLSLLSIGSVYRVREWQGERQELREQIARLNSELALLREVREQLNRPETLTELARCQGFVGGQEAVYVSSTPVPDTPGNCDAPRLP